MHRQAEPPQQDSFQEDRQLYMKRLHHRLKKQTQQITLRKFAIAFESICSVYSLS